MVVQLTEAEYYRVMALQQAVTLEIQSATQVIEDAKARVAAKESARNAYLVELARRYPDFVIDRDYAGDDATHALCPVTA